MEKKTMMQTMNVKTITYTALFAAIATVVMYFEFPLPLMPPFLKVDLSGIVILIGAFIFGPLSALFMCGVKDLIHLLSTQTGGVGELGDFLMTGSLVLTAALIYRRVHTRKGALIGCVAGTCVMAGVGMLVNKFLLIPFYSNIMPIEAIFETCRKVNPAVHGLGTYLLFGVLPFNLIKGAIISIVTFLLYKRLSHFIRSNRMSVALDNKKRGR